MQRTLRLDVTNNVDYSLYLITDDGSPHSVISQVRSAIAGGASLIQYRAKNKDSAELYAEASQIAEIVHKAKKHLIINDRIDIALAVGADGVHLGPEDLPVSVARRIMGATAIIGASVSNVESAIEAELEGANYLGVGAVYDTMTKLDAGAGIGVEVITDIKSAVSIPVVGIGGIKLNNVAEVIASGADGAAVISAITREKNITSAVKDFLLAIRQAKG